MKKLILLSPLLLVACSSAQPLVSIEKKAEMVLCRNDIPTERESLTFSSVSVAEAIEDCEEAIRKDYLFHPHNRGKLYCHLGPRCPPNKNPPHPCIE
jgi:hypothetical protein